MKPFHFKQFSIEQDACAMKVTLDACLFGALCDVKNSLRILDIGTGTGLLALMAAQRSHARIDAIELDASAYHQAKTNIENSRFNQSVQLFHQDIKQFEAPQGYDTILCNPPFFSDHLKGPDAQRNQARHNDSLSFHDLSTSIAKHLTIQGKAWMLLPCHELASFLESAQQQQLHVSKCWQIQSKPDKAPHRYIFTVQHNKPDKFDQNKVIETAEKIIIRQPSTGEYTTKFKSLLSDFYLKL